VVGLPPLVVARPGDSGGLLPDSGGLLPDSGGLLPPVLPAPAAS
jgi:hypothetical protein